MKLPVSFGPEENFDVPIVDTERQQRDEQIIDFFENAFHILIAYQGQQRADMRLMSTRAMAMALGFHLAAGADGPAGLAVKCGVSKQAMGKCLNHFISQLKLPQLLCQRNHEARKNMSLARKDQIDSTPRETTANVR